jgi:hypothetical protein
VARRDHRRDAHRARRCGAGAVAARASA